VSEKNTETIVLRLTENGLETRSNYTNAKPTTFIDHGNRLLRKICVWASADANRVTVNAALAEGGRTFQTRAIELPPRTGSHQASNDVPWAGLTAGSENSAAVLYQWWTLQKPKHIAYVDSIFLSPVSGTCIMQTWDRIHLVPDSGAD